MKEYTYEEFCEIPMTLLYQFVTQRTYMGIRLSRETGVAMMVISPNKHNGYKGKAKVTYAFEEKKYQTSDAVYVAYMAKACGVEL